MQFDLILDARTSADVVATVMASQKPIVKAFSAKSYLVDGMPKAMKDKLMAALILTITGVRVKNRV